MKKKYLALLFFLFSFVLLLQFFNIKPQHLISPLPSHIDTFSDIRLKLEQKRNTFTIKKQTTLIPQSYATSTQNNASAYIVLNYNTGEAIAEKNMTQKLPIASLTKVMTAVVALDLASPDEIFSTTRKAATIEPTHIAMRQGEKMTLEELLHAALITSANDATQVIKDGIDKKYGKTIFIRAMNEKAAILGLKNTHFTNPQGFDNPNHFSTVDDFALLSHYALTHYPLISKIVQKDSWKLTANKNHPYHNLYNWNGLLDVYPGVQGLKIGNTNKAGKTTAVVAERQGIKILVVLLGAPGIIERDQWSANLLDMGFEKLGNLEPINITEQQLREKYATWRYGD